MREIPITPSMQAAIDRVNGGEHVDPSTIAVFEARSVNTRPLRRKGGLFQAGIVQPSALSEMVQHLNDSSEGVPLHVMHNTEMLNIGKLFQARVDKATDGADELSSQFYIPRNNQAVISNLNSGVTDQVSVGLQAKRIKCSKCDFDYRQGGFENIMAGQCPKKHVIGKDGVHVELHGMDSWGELSLVDRGAATDARTVSAANSRFTEGSKFYSLAANHNELGTSIPLIATLDDISGEETNQVDEAKIADLLKTALKENGESNQTLLTAKQVEVDTAKTALTAAEGARDEANTNLTAAQGQITTLTSERDTARTERDTTAAAFKEAEGFLIEQATKAQVASNVKSPKTAANFTEALTIIKESGVNLVNLYARDSNPVHMHTDDTGVNTALSAKESVRGFRRKEQN